MTVGVARSVLVGGGTDFATIAEYEVGSFTANTSTGTQSVTGVGFTPKALMFWTSGSAAASGTWDGDAHRVVGFTSGPSESFAVSSSAADAAASSDTGHRIAAKCITIVDHDGGTTIGEADLDSFDSDGFTVDWTDAPVTADEIMFVAIGGSEVSAKAINWSNPASTGNESITGVGFEPDVVLHAIGGTTTAVPSNSTGAYGGLGAMDSSGNQWSASFFANDNVSTMDTHRYQVTDACLNLVSTALQVEASWVSMDADGFTLNFSDTNGAGWENISLCLSGVTAEVGHFDKSTDLSTPVSQTVTGVSFKPSALLLGSICTTDSESVQDDAVWSFGASDGVTERATLQVDEDNVATSSAESVWDSGKTMMVEGDTAGTIDAEADLNSFNSDGFTLSWTTNDATALEILYLALG